jgi:hypothetical protein
MPKNQKGKRRAGEVDRLPPHNIEAEQGVLGCILLSPKSCMSEVLVRVKDWPVFFDLRHETIFKCMATLHRAGKPIELIGLLDELRRTGHLEEIGGVAYLSSITDAVPSSANLGYFLDILLEHYRRRKIISTFTEISARVYDHQGDIDELLYATRSDLAMVMDSGDGKEEVWTVDELSAFDFEHDPNAVIGFRNGMATRFLCRGYSAWLIGQSGIGKSSILTQWAIKLACGKDFCGILSNTPRRVGIIQAENDMGDTAEFTQGILRSLSIGEFDAEKEYMLVKRNLVIITERQTVGEQFCSFLERMIGKYEMEIVFADPFLSFAAVDVTRLSDCSRFLRQQVNPVLHRTGAILICAHHSGKPKFEKGLRTPSALDYAYAGIGSSELVNWARAVMVLLPVGNDGINYELKICKRGGRAGALSLAGEETTSVFLKHSADRVFWEQTTPPQEEEERAPKEPRKTIIDQIVAANTHEVISRIPDEGETKNSLGQRLHEWATREGIVCGLTKCKEALSTLSSNRVGKLSYRGGLYFKGVNA